MTAPAVPLAAAAQLPAIEAGGAARAADAAPSGGATATPAANAEVLVAALEPAALRLLVREVLERSPAIARAEQQAAAAAARGPQMRALPDPVASLNLFVLPPETRVGPQQVSAAVAQAFPWFGKLALREQAALYTAAAAAAQVEAVRLDTLTEVRRLVYELSFVDAHQAILTVEREALVRFEKTAQARYRSGRGLQQESVRIQAQITRADVRLLELAERRAALIAALNGLRDRPAGEPAPRLDLPAPRTAPLDREALRRWAAARRPELAAAAARIAATESQVALAEKGYRPDVTVGLSYTLVGRRGDAPGRLNPPPDNGDDILGLSAAVKLPVWRQSLDAAVAEAEATRWAAEAERQQLLAGIESTIGDLAARLPLLAQHLELLESVLMKQAGQSLRSAETAYSTGKLNAVDLLDAEVVMFEVQIAAARTRADLAIAWAQLERAVAAPLPAQDAASSLAVIPVEKESEP
jgi:outer membrane protein TolC